MKLKKGDIVEVKTSGSTYFCIFKEYRREGSEFNGDFYHHLIDAQTRHNKITDATIELRKIVRLMTINWEEYL